MGFRKGIAKPDHMMAGFESLGFRDTYGEQHFGLPKNVFSSRNYSGAAGGERLIDESRREASAALYHYAATGFGEQFHRLGRDRDPPFTGESFFYSTYN